MPEVPLNEDGKPEPPDLENLALAIRDFYAEGRIPKDAVQALLTKQDYRFVERLLELLQNSDEVSELRQDYEEHLEGSIEALKKRRSQVADAIEQAVVDGIIPDEQTDEQANYKHRIFAIDPEETLNFSLKYTELNQIEGELKEARGRRRTQLREEWETLRKLLGVKLGNPHPADAIDIDVQRGLNPTEAKWGAGDGWRYYCAHGLLRACEMSLQTGESVIISFD